MTKPNSHITLSEFWTNYHSEVVFGFVLAAIVVASTWVSQFIPDNIFDNVLTPALNICTATAGLFGAWVIFRHSEGMLMRRLWGYVLLVWFLGDTFYLLCYLIAPMQVMNMGAERLTTFELLFGNLLGWTMTLYPTETLRPGWLSPKIVAWQLVPMFILVALDYVVPFSLWPIVALYPYALLVMVLSHIRAYRIWCEENYSTMDNIDVQWIIRYCIMLFLIGANYMYMCTTHDHARGLTQQWFVVFMLVYSTEQILYRKDPWEGMRGDKPEQKDESAYETPGVASDDDCRKLELWMETEKPYLNPELKLIDLRAVLPTNRTYISQLINSNYSCSFYQFVNRYRIDEAKRLMQEQPGMKMADIATRCGFSSRTVFTNTFTREVGISPTEWSKQKNAI